MKRVRQGRRLAFILSSSVLPCCGYCLPEDYIAMSARGLSVALADTLLTVAVSPLFEAIGQQAQDDEGDAEEN